MFEDMIDSRIHIVPSLRTGCSNTAAEDCNLLLCLSWHSARPLVVCRQDIVTWICQEKSHHLQWLVGVLHGVQHQQSITVHEMLREDGTVHLSQWRVANESRAQTAVATYDFSRVGDGASSSAKRHCHLTKGLVRSTTDSAHWWANLLVDHHVLLLAKWNNAMVNQVS